MRTAIFVLVGIVVGVAVARLRTTGKSPSRREAPVMSAVEAASPEASMPMGSAYRDGVRQRDLSPKDGRYDPVALLEEDESLSAKEIFENEPRDPLFAPIMEKRAQAVLEIVFRELEIEHKIREIHVECKTLSCYTYIEVSKADGRDVYVDINGILLGDVQTPGLVNDGDRDMSRVTIYNLHRPATRDVAYYQRLLEETMRPPLEYVKQRRRQGSNEAPP